MLCVICAIAAIVAFVCFFAKPPVFNKTDGDFAVTISIDCKTILHNTDKLDLSLKNTKYIPDDGVILPPVTVWVHKGDSVLDALKTAAFEHNIQLEYSQSINACYVEGINYIYEFSCGDLSGWMYTVNGIFADKGCDTYILAEDDCIKWVYTCDLGKDVGETMREIR